MSSSESTQNISEAARPTPTAASPSLDNDLDDLDDLDDVLDEFNNPHTSTSAAATVAATPGPPKSQPPPPTDAPVAIAASADNTDPASASKYGDGNDDLHPDGLDDILSQDFAKELAQGMEALMKELGQANPTAAASEDASTSGQQDPQLGGEELMRQFEAMMAGFSQPGGGAAASASQTNAKPSTSAPAAPGATGQPANFNDAVKATMNRLKESDASATASISSSADPFAALGGAGGRDMAKLLAAFGAGGEGGGEGGLDNPELAKMLEGMMDELMSKEILYEPLKELRDKYPAYLAGPEAAKDSKEDRERYEAQAKYVGAIVELFEDPKYDAKNKETTTKIQDLMNHMQDCGSPPQQIVGDMPAELENIPGFGGPGGDNGECTIM